MAANLRASMAWVHTWFGLVLGFVLMASFFFGSLSVFDREIDRWAIPETRFSPTPMPSFDDVIQPTLAHVTPDGTDYEKQIQKLHDANAGALPNKEELIPDRYWAYITHRDPVLATGVRFRVPHPAPGFEAQRVRGDIILDPRTGNVIQDDSLRIGSAWFYPMHYNLNWTWMNLGYFVVGIAAFMMLVALVTGIIIHRRLVREFFTFRPWKLKQRATLDLHNMTGVLALPFHFFFALTGLIIFAASVYLPVTQSTLKPLHDQQHIAESKETGLPATRSGVPATLGSVDAMMQSAKQIWAQRGIPGDVGYLLVHHLGDANSYVSIYRAGSDRVALVGEGVHFQGTTGNLIYTDPPESVSHEISEFLTGLHLQHFEHWLLRWLYLLGGLMGCACIATGFFFYVEKRRRLYPVGMGRIDALAITATTGMVIATLGILLANRVLPADLEAKDYWEKATFWALWVLAMLHAFMRASSLQRTAFSPAWHEQVAAIAVLSAFTVLANWLSTGDHLIKTIFIEPYWPIASIDLFLLVSAVLFAAVSKKLKHHHTVREVTNA